MKLNSYFLYLSVALAAPAQMHALFEHDSAVHAAQKELWPAAMERMKKAVSAHPEDAQVIYDAGVAAYRLGDFSQAQAYFHQAGELAHDARLQELAAFNEGNAQAYLKQYKEAIASYEKALALNTDNTQAQENRELVQKLLEQQQQQQEKEKNKDKKEEQKEHDKDKQQDQQQNDQEKNEEGEDQEGNSNDQGNQSNETQDQQSSGGQDADDSREEPNEQSQKKSSQQNREQHKKSHQQQPSSVGKDDQSRNRKEQARADAPSGQDRADTLQQPSPQQVSAWLDKVLSERENQDNALNKALVKAQVAQQGKGSQNVRANW